MNRICQHFRPLGIRRSNNLHKVFIWTAIVVPALLLFHSCSAPLQVSDAEWQLYRMVDTLEAEDPNIQLIVSPYRNVIQEEMEEVIGQASVSLTRGRPESTLGNFMGDLIMARGPDYFDEPADFAIHNPGGLRIPEINPGVVRVSDIYQLMPFDNTIVLLEMTGDQLPMLFNRMAQSGGWPISKEVNFHISEGEATNVLISGKPIEPERVYRILMPDYVAVGGSDCDFLVEMPRKDSGVFTRDIIIEYIRSEQAEGRPLSAKIEGRIINKDRTAQ